MAKQNYNTLLNEASKPRIGGKQTKPEPMKEINGVKLTEINYVRIDELTENKNNKIFKTETKEYFQRLTDDIKKRGIIVPLIADVDGVLLAGHNRLQIAKELNFETIPVQYVKGKLSDNEKSEFLIKDNVLRRHLTTQERFDLYRKLYPDFDEKIKVENRGGNTVNKGLNKGQESKSEKSSLTAEIISKKTGIGKSIVE